MERIDHIIDLDSPSQASSLSQPLASSLPACTSSSLHSSQPSRPERLKTIVVNDIESEKLPESTTANEDFNNAIEQSDDKVVENEPVRNQFMMKLK